MAPAFSLQERERLVALVKENPGMTLEEIKDAFSKSCSLMSVHRTLKRLGFRYKNSTGRRTGAGGHSWKSKKPDWFSKDSASRPIIFLDESSAKTNMTQLRFRDVVW